MENIRVGIVGLGGIAQKAYLPILTKETNWTLVGAFSPSVQKRDRICRQYRMNSFASLQALASACDAVFVHSSTESHFEVTSTLLKNGIDVYVDKPLAQTTAQAEKLVALSEKTGRKIMVGFNRRFAPCYLEAKVKIHDAGSVHMEKHRLAGIGRNLAFTIMDDYIHLVDTIRWLADGDLKVAFSYMKTNEKAQLIHAHHLYKADTQTLYSTAMHRSAGTNLERLEIIMDGSVIRVKNMTLLEEEREGTVTATAAGSWEPITKLRGFEGAVSHFIASIQQDTQPVSNALEGWKTQLLAESLLSDKS
ncbi:Gfo/Idh/MocA family protein [Virgibacillus halophilus]|uniref:Gfo/Idh/MocA family protein n=1 Tax=Tigheibacillus halophilus TaxID=361280 RepID=UPI0036252D61